MSVQRESTCDHERYEEEYLWSEERGIRVRLRWISIIKKIRGQNSRSKASPEERGIRVRLRWISIIFRIRGQ